MVEPPKSPTKVLMFTILELQNATKTIKLDKALGPDGIPRQVVIQEFPHILRMPLDVTLSPEATTHAFVSLDKEKASPIRASSFGPLRILDITRNVLVKH